jgi:hypothetical protein
MAPEQFAGRTDPRSDQYAFCVSLFEALSGRRLFSGSPMRMLAQKKAGPPSTARLPNRIGNVIRRGLHPEPQLRFASMEALLDALSPRPREARWAAWLGVVVLGAAGLGLVSESEPGPCIDPPRWDSARREALAASLQQRGESARPVARQAVEALDRDVEATRIEIGRVCDDGAGAPERERRIACLHRRVARIDTTVDVLLEDGSRAATHALEVIDDLGERSGCDGPNLPPPADPATRFEARRIAAILYRARALADLGDPLACRSPISRTSSSRPRSPKRRSDTGGGHS